MVVELVGNQIRIRIKSPSRFKKDSFVTLDVGEKGKLQKVRAIEKGKTKFSDQSYRINMDDYSLLGDAKKDIQSIRGIKPKKKSRARILAQRWWIKNR